MLRKLHFHTGSRLVAAPSAMLAVILALLVSQAAAASPAAAPLQQTPSPTPTTQIGFILDSSGSIGVTNWNTIKTGLARALNDPLCVPHDGSVEFTLTTFSTHASVNVAPTVLTTSSLPAVLSTVNNLAFLGQTTNISEGLRKTADAMRASSNYSAVLKQAVNLVTDGEPNVNVDASPCNGVSDNKANTVCWRNYLLSRLQMTGLPDQLDGEFIGKQGTNSEWKRTSIVFPQPGSYADLATNTFNPGWVLVVPDAAGFSAAVCQKLQQLVEPAGTVTKTPNPSSLPDPGGPVQFTVRIENDINRAIDLISLKDSPYGSITAVGGSITATTCSVPHTLQPSDGVAGSGSDTYSCTFTANVTGQPGSYPDTVTAGLRSSSGNTISVDGSATVIVTDVPATIEVVKTANPTAVSEPGGDVTFSFEAKNTSAMDAVTINSLTDSVYGDLKGKGSCVVPQTIAAGGSYSCSFTTRVSGNAGNLHTNTVTATGVDDDGQAVSDTDNATVSIQDIPSSIEIVKTANSPTVAEPGDNVTFNFEVKNTSAVDAVTIKSLTDSVYGDLKGKGSCVVPQTIAAGGSYSCAITVFVGGNAGDVHINTVTVAGVDDDGKTVGATDEETVTISDVPSTIDLVKTANPSAVDEPGGDVTFSFEVKNTSAVDAVTINSLTDSVYGDLNGKGSCVVPQTIAAGGSYSCAITEFVGGNAGDIHTNTVTVKGTDDDRQAVADTDDATVTIQDVSSSVEIVKTASPNAVDEPGGDVTFSFEVKNTSAVDAVTISSITDSVYGDLKGKGSCVVPQTIAAGGSYSCAVTAFVGGNAGDVHTNVVKVTVVDDDGQVLTDSDDATVTVEDVQGVIEVAKTASPTAVSEPGGDVTFSFVVNNLSIIDAVTINSLTDSVYGDLSGKGSCVVPQTIAPNGSYSCSFTTRVSGNAGNLHTNTVTVAGVDDDGKTVGDNDDATVTILDVPSAIEILKTADPTAVSEPGGDVTFSFVVNNLSTMDAVTINSLTDSIYGDLKGKGNCVVPQTIAAKGSYSCAITVFVGGNAGVVHTNVVTVAGIDDDGQAVADTDDAVVTIQDVPSTITVAKTASPTTIDEPGGDVTFSFVVNNLSIIDAVTINSLTDSVYGDLKGKGSCVMPQTIAPNGSYSCAITAFVGGNAGAVHINTVTAAGVDDDGKTVGDNDDATVTILDVLSTISVVKTANPATVDEPGGDVTFSFAVNNLSIIDAVMINSLTDSVYGDLNGKGSCVVPQTIAAGGSYSCAITEFVGGNAGAVHTNVVTVAGIDDDGQAVDDTADATTAIIDVPASIDIVKTANPSIIAEPGGDVTFSFEVKNTSAVDAVTINSLTDSVYGDLKGKGSCVVPQTIAAGGSYSCAITEFVGGNAGDVHTNVVTAGGVDDDGQAVAATDDATVTIENVPSAIEILKTADPATVNEPGGDVTFSFVVNNLSTMDAMVINSLTDSIYGDLKGKGSCVVPQTIAAGGSYNCSFTTQVSGNAGYVHTNVATVAGVDDDGQAVADSDDATVTVEDVQGVIEVAKTASPTAVSEPGGDVTFSFVVNNLSIIDAVTINSLTDSVYGDLSGKGSCVVPQTIAPNGSYSCSFTTRVSGNAGNLHTNTVTVAGVDDDGKTVGDTDEEMVTIDDVPSAIEIVKTANPGSVVEPGGDVTFSFEVKNTSAMDAVTINSLTDNIYGDLNGKGSCVVPQTIAAGGSYNCAVTEYVSGNAGTTHTNVATITGIDDDGQAVGDTDDETVISTDVPSSIKTTKTASPRTVPETGDDVTYTIMVQNTSLVDTVTIATVVDSVFGDVSATCSPVLPANLAPGASVKCSFTRFISGDAGQIHTNVATATGVDDDGNEIQEGAREDVTIVDVLPDISVAKTANPSSVLETGGNVTFTFVVTNNGGETATISGLSDSVYGVLTGDADCQVGTVLPAGSSCEFSLIRFVSGDSSGDDHSNVFTGKATDDEGNEGEDTAEETVDFVDVLPDITVTKSADPASVPETGGSVIFTFMVANNSSEPAAITTLSDDKFGVLSGDADCHVGTVLAGSASCTFSTAFVLPAGVYPGVHVNVFTATAADNDGNTDKASDSATVTYTDVPAPRITVTKVVTGTKLTSWSFVLRLDGGDPKTVASDQPHAIWDNLEADRTYTLSEDEPGNGWAEGTFECNVNGVSVGESLPDGDLKLRIVPGDDVVCVKYNADITVAGLDPMEEPGTVFGVFLPAITR